VCIQAAEAEAEAEAVKIGLTLTCPPWPRRNYGPPHYYQYYLAFTCYFFTSRVNVSFCVVALHIYYISIYIYPSIYPSIYEKDREKVRDMVYIYISISISNMAAARSSFIARYSALPFVSQTLRPPAAVVALPARKERRELYQMSYEALIDSVLEWQVAAARLAAVAE